MGAWNKIVWPRVHWIAAAGLGLLAALAALYIAYTVGQYATELSPDETNYISMARRLVDEGVYSFWGKGPDAYVSPGYPLFLALCAALFGEGSLTAARVLQCLMAGGTAALTVLLGRKLTGRTAAGVIAGVLIVCNGGYYFLSRLILTETLYFFLMMLSLLLLLRAEEKNALWRFALAGGVFGCAVMVRSLVVIILPFLALPRVLRWRKDKSVSLKPILWFFAGFLIPCLPWWLRNLVTLHKLIFWAAQTNPVFGGLHEDPEHLGYHDPGTYLGNFKLFIEFFRNDPKGMLSWMTQEKFRIIFLSDVVMPEAAITDTARNMTVSLGLCGAALGFACRRTRLQSLPFWAYLLPIFISVPSFRYAYQYLLLLAVFSGWLLTRAWDAIRER
ncbi:MAG: glycosyltransferase family 39 protein [Oscillospiraceae bacterium]|nr:glycosyltransferase family 39 protein [Oscillospiraceae bacterium]